MLTKIRQRLAQEEGFTLIELLVVILIIGILAAVAIPTFLSQKNKATDSNAQSNLKNAQTVVESYASGNNGTYPAGSGAITSALTNDSDATALGSGTQAVQYYATQGTSDTYVLCSVGSSNSTPHTWYLFETAGNVTYGVDTTSSTCSPNETISSLTQSSTSGFPAIQTS